MEKASSRYGNSTTYSGFPVDEMKSGLQKYIRRGMKEKAWAVAYELYLMHMIEDSAYKSLFSRLAVIAAEDIGVADPGVVDLVIRTAMGWKTAASKKKSSIPPFSEVMALIVVMCDSRKTRVMSWIWNSYTNPNSIPLTMGYTNADGSRPFSVDTSFNQEDLNHPNQTSFFQSGDDQRLIAYGTIFLNRLTKKNLNAIVWLNQFLKVIDDNGTKSKLKVTRNGKTRAKAYGGRTGNKTRPEIIIFDIYRAILGSKVVDTYEDAYFDSTDSRVFIMMPLTMIMMNIGCEKCPMKLDPKLVSQIRESYVSTYENHQYAINLEPFVIDKHTKRGRRTNGQNTRAFFVSQGCQISNETNFGDVVNAYRWIYNNTPE